MLYRNGVEFGKLKGLQTLPLPCGWLIMSHDRLRTAQHLYRCHVIESEQCLLCGAGVEDGLHVLQDCLRPRRTWEFLLPGTATQEFWDCNSLEHWLDFNLSRPRDSLVCIPRWSYIFREAVHSVWRSRNPEIFQDRETCPRPVIFAKLILERVFKLLSAWGDEIPP